MREPEISKHDFRGSIFSKNLIYSIDDSGSDFLGIRYIEMGLMPFFKIFKTNN